VGNDEFVADYDPAAIGLYEYEVAGLIDHFSSWLDGFQKKAESGGPLDVELLIGAELLGAAAGRATGEEAKRLAGWAEFLGDGERDLGQRVQLARTGELAELARRFPDRSLEVGSPIGLMLIERERAAFSAWYEFFPRSCRDDGVTHATFDDAQGRLPEIARMGFNVVYLPPIHPIGRKFRKGRNNALEAAPDDVGSPWAIGAAEGGHKAVLPELGTLEDFKRFVAAAESHGLEVALDIAFQCAPDHPWVKEHPQWFRWRPDGTVQYAENPPKKYQDILPINFETEDWENLWQELKSVFEFWIEAGVKIFRVDNPHTKSMEFWRWCILELKRHHPETLYLAEAFTRPKRKYRLAKAGFTHGYTYFTWRNHPRELREYLEELTLSPVKEYFWPNFWPNTPDILHADLQFGTRATFVGRLVLAATLSSNYGLYGPAYELMEQEPYPGKEEYNHNEKYQLKAWDWDRPGNLKPELARLNRIRNEHAAFQRTFNLHFVPSDNPHFIAYLKQNFDRTDQFLVVVNMDWENERETTLHLPLARLGYGSDAGILARDLFDPATPEYRWRGSATYVKLNPARSPAHIFQLRRA
jgi:starch synthase (maltosyl-transferring)